MAGSSPRSRGMGLSLMSSFTSGNIAGGTNTLKPCDKAGVTAASPLLFKSLCALEREKEGEASRGESFHCRGGRSAALITTGWSLQVTGTSTWHSSSGSTEDTLTRATWFTGPPGKGENFAAREDLQTPEEELKKVKIHVGIISVFWCASKNAQCWILPSKSCRYWWIWLMFKMHSYLNVDLFKLLGAEWSQ